jgi:hypothetical protein
LESSKNSQFDVFKNSYFDANFFKVSGSVEQPIILLIGIRKRGLKMNVALKIGSTRGQC